MNRMVLSAWALLAVLVTGAGVESQSLRDTLSAYQAALGSHAPDGRFVGPEGEVQYLCTLFSSEAGFVMVSDDPRYQRRDTLPDLTPRLREVAMTILQAEFGLTPADQCDGYRTSTDELGARVGLSGPKFDGPDRVEIYVSVMLAGLWGSGRRCTWTRGGSGQPWGIDDCSRGWISDRPPQPDALQLSMRGPLRTAIAGGEYVYTIKEVILSVEVAEAEVGGC